MITSPARSGTAGAKNREQSDEICCYRSRVCGIMGKYVVVSPLTTISAAQKRLHMSCFRTTVDENMSFAFVLGRGEQSELDLSGFEIPGRESACVCNTLCRDENSIHSKQTKLGHELTAVRERYDFSLNKTAFYTGLFRFILYTAIGRVQVRLLVDDKLSRKATVSPEEDRKKV